MAQLWRRLEKPDQFCGRAVAVPRMAKWQFAVHLVPIPASFTGFREVAGLREIVDDLRGGSLGDADDVSDVS